MPSYWSGVDSFIGEKLTNADWIQVVEHLHGCIMQNKLLETHSLSLLGQAVELRGDKDNFHGTHGIAADNPEVDSRLTPNPLKIQGLFSASGGSFIGDRGKIRYWGLARSGKWISIVAKGFVANYRPGGLIIEKAKRVFIGEFSLSDLCRRSSVSPEEIWKYLAEKVLEWKRRDEERLYVITPLASLVETQMMLLQEQQRINSV